MTQTPETAADAVARRNVELKARYQDFASARRIATQLGAQRQPDLRQRDTYFRARNGRLKLREVEDGPATLVAYARPDVVAGRTSQYYLVPQPDPGAALMALAETLGIRCVVDKHRELWLIGQTRLHLDAVHGLGRFLEFEVVLTPGQSETEGERILAELRRRFGIADDQLVAVGYADLLEKGEGPPAG